MSVNELTTANLERWSAARARAREVAGTLDRLTLLAVVTTRLPDFAERHERAAMIAAAKRELEWRYPCHDCGAGAGRSCRAEYGCRPDDRRPGTPDVTEYGRRA